MDGLARTAGLLHRKISVGGKEYLLATPRLRDYAEAEAQILAKLFDPIEKAALASAHVPPEQQAMFWEAAFKAAQTLRKVSLQEDIKLLPDSYQLAITAYVTLRRFHSDEIRSLDDALDWVERAINEHGLDQLNASLSGAAEETPPKKSPEAPVE